MIRDCLPARLPSGTPAGENNGPQAAAPPLAVQVERCRRFYEPIFRNLYDNPTMRLRDIEQLEQIASGYRSRRRFLTDLTLDPPSSTSDFAQPPHRDEDWLTLSTIHSAKGCEWHVVHVLHVADGMIPSDMATGSEAEIEEERRLLYVAMTRAKDCLYLYFPLRYYYRPRGLGDAHGFAQLSRFLTQTVRAQLEERAQAFADEPPQAFHAEKARDQVNQYLRDLWED
jgi:DNA helicase-2/ATP-dependent DNA helicase PcrA